MVVKVTAWLLCYSLVVKVTAWLLRLQYGYIMDVKVTVWLQHGF